MVEAVMLWNEPDNKSRWGFEIDPEWDGFAEMVKRAAMAVGAKTPRLLRVLGSQADGDRRTHRRQHSFSLNRPST